MKRGYTIIEQDGAWLATSIHLQAFGEGADPEAALDKCIEAEWLAKERPDVRVPAIKEAVALACDLLGLLFEDLVSDGRVRSIVTRRRIVWWLLWNAGNGYYRVFSSLDVMRAVGRPNHSTIMTGCACLAPFTQTPEWALLVSAWRDALRRRQAERIDTTPWGERLLVGIDQDKGHKHRKAVVAA